MASLDVEALLDATAEQKSPTTQSDDQAKQESSNRNGRDQDRDRGRNRDDSRTRFRDRDHDRRRRDRRDLSPTRSRRDSPDEGTPRSDTGSHKKTVTTTEAAEAALVPDPVHLTAATALVITAIAENVAIATTVTGLMTAPRRRTASVMEPHNHPRTSKTPALCLFSSLQPACVLVS
ncbi:hypothetical protein V2G26_016106 [Clonostachys chloroleuca]